MYGTTFEVATNPMVAKDIFERVVSVIADTLQVSASALSFTTKIKEDLHVDSMQIVTLMIALDDEFNAEFNLEMIPTGEVTIEWICEFVGAAMISSG